MISLDKKYKTVGGYEVKLEKINTRVGDEFGYRTFVKDISVSGKWKDSRGVWCQCEWDIKTGYLYGTNFPGKLSLIEIEENMISLDKKYKTVDRNEVVLLEIYNNTVFGRIKTDFGGWKSSQWTIDGINCQYVNYNLVKVPEFKIVTLKPNFIKPVLYYGTLFTVPKNINYMATDKDGTVFGYSTKPILEADGNIWVNTDYTDGVEISVVEFEGDWCQSLQQV
jgi:hypothetical protein